MTALGRAIRPFGLWRIRLHVDLAQAAGIALTVSRIPLLAAAAYLVLSGRTGVEFALILGAIVLADVFDGVFFGLSPRTTSVDATRRHIVDAIGDRVVIHTLFAVALLSGSLDFAAYLPVLVRELILAATVSRPYLKSGLVLPANTVSKLATALVAVLLFQSLHGLTSVLTLVAFCTLAYFGIREYSKYRD